MLTALYSIYVNKRPLRIAVLLENKPESLTIIDTLLADNRNRRGGPLSRSCVILLCRGERSPC